MSPNACHFHSPESVLFVCFFGVCVFFLGRGDTRHLYRPECCCLSANFKSLIQYWYHTFTFSVVPSYLFHNEALCCISIGERKCSHVKLCSQDSTGPLGSKNHGLRLLICDRSSNSLSSYIPKKIGSLHPHKILYKNVHSSIIQNSQNVETTQMFTK